MSCGCGHSMYSSPQVMTNIGKNRPRSTGIVEVKVNTSFVLVLHGGKSGLVSEPFLVWCLKSELTCHEKITLYSKNISKLNSSQSKDGKYIFLFFVHNMEQK
jgi:hypothetical protein